MNWDLIANILVFTWILIIVFIIWIWVKEHRKNDKECENYMGFNKDEDNKSEYLAIRDNLELLRDEIKRGHLKQSIKRIDYILNELI